jgi:chromosome segregation ATPase
LGLDGLSIVVSNHVGDVTCTFGAEKYISAAETTRDDDMDRVVKSILLFAMTKLAVDTDALQLRKRLAIADGSVEELKQLGEMDRLQISGLMQTMELLKTLNGNLTVQLKVDGEELQAKIDALQTKLSEQREEHTKLLEQRTKQLEAEKAARKAKEADLAAAQQELAQRTEQREQRTKELEAEKAASKAKVMAKEDELGRVFRDERRRLEFEVQSLKRQLANQGKALIDFENSFTSDAKLLDMLATSEAKVRGF